MPKDYNIGCITGKPNIISVITKYRDVLKIIEDVHQMNSKKWPYFSWQNTPAESDSTPEDIFNAILRHVLAYSMKNTVDAESHTSHLHHMLCRMGMFVTAAYRTIRNIQPTLDTDKKLYSDVNYSQITPEEIIFLLKYDKYHTPVKKGSIVPILISKLIEMSTTEIPIFKNRYKVKEKYNFKLPYDEVLKFEECLFILLDFILYEMKK